MRLLNQSPPTERGQNLARARSQVLTRLITRYGIVSLHADGADADTIDLPAGVAHLLQSLLEQIGHGQRVIVLPVERELTTIEAVEIVGVSRSFSLRLLEQGDIPFHRAGARRRIRLQDLLTYRKEKLRQQTILDEMVHEAQELNMRY